MAAQVQTIIATGTQGTIVDVECHLSNNLPNIVIVGFANRAVDESRERIRGAFATSHIMLPRKRITINLAPADVPKADSSFDLAMAVAILAADGQVTRSIDLTQAFIGELGLNGSVRAVRGIIGKIMIGRAKGIKTFFIPADNLQQAQLVPDVTLIPIHSLTQLCDYFCHGVAMEQLESGSGKHFATPDSHMHSTHLSEIVGQQLAKRALIIAAAGGHNIFFNGPPGTGKSMLAKALQSVLPPLSREEVLEVTHLHSLASHDYERIVSRPPFRSPHHSASFVAITGGGAALLPGEISLAHRGVLFLDELPEFGRDTLEALRQPLEDRSISIARAHGRADYPANFIFVATGNPCPCGYAGTDRCKCPAGDITRYQNRLSGPILDRIDIHSNVDSVKHDKLLTSRPNSRADERARLSIITARQIQAKRFHTTSRLNSDMTNEEIKRLTLITSTAVETLNLASAGLGLSARAYMRTIKVARTIADLDSSKHLLSSHITDALAYRPESQKSQPV